MKTRTNLKLRHYNFTLSLNKIGTFIDKEIGEMVLQCQGDFLSLYDGNEVFRISFVTSVTLSFEIMTLAGFIAFDRMHTITPFFSPAGFMMSCGYCSWMPGHFRLWLPSWTD